MRSVVDGVARRPIRRLVHEHAVDRSRALQAGGGVHDVPRGHPLALGRSRVEGHERFPGRDPDAELESCLATEVADGERRANGSFGVVFVGGGSSEERHHRVADELLDCAAVALELRSHSLVVRTEQRLDVFGIHRLGLGGETHEVAEEHADDLSLSPPPLRHGERLRPGR